jgi:hypothetical protein
VTVAVDNAVIAEFDFLRFVERLEILQRCAVMRDVSVRARVH